MATVSDMKADMVILSALIRDGMTAALPPSPRLATAALLYPQCRFPPLDSPLQVILGSMQLSKFKPGGLVIGSLASNIPHMPRAHPRT